MKKNISEIIERIKKIKGLSTEGDVASVLKMTAANLSNYKTRGAVPYEQLSSFCEEENISLDQLLTGEPEKPSGVAEEQALYGDSETTEILHLLKQSPHDKKLVLKLLKARKEMKEALEGLGVP